MTRDKETMRPHRSERERAVRICLDMAEEYENGGDEWDEAVEHTARALAKKIAGTE